MLRFFKPKPETAMALLNLGAQSLILGYVASRSTGQSKAPGRDNAPAQEENLSRPR
ncbi:hypothetical protein Lery_2656 [Legionella erythra]|uniref:Uncharacterized protein n=2 Tax=Legionella erythra TaxID=448 RepID=A0A0W0TFY3_LEGER|nr:hypothetical protein Lery_2656 [Legionella erythra]